ncbi:hypothetical protein V6N13_004837 [Hibiscus sabdariffa]
MGLKWYQHSQDGREIFLALFRRRRFIHYAGRLELVLSEGEFSKYRVLITTSYAGRINEIIQVEVGNDSFEVGVRELGFKDDTVDPLCKVEKKKIPVRLQSEDSSDTISTSERFPSSGRKENNFDSGRLMERVAVLEKEVNLEGADKQFEENEEVKEYHCEVEKAGCDHHVEVGGRSCIDADKGIAKKSWAKVLIDHRPTQSLAQTESFLDLGPHSKNLFSKVNVELEAGGEDLESGLLGQHAGKEITQLEEVQSPKPIEGTGRDAALSSLDNFGEMETLPPKTRASKKYGSLCEGPGEKVGRG